MRCSQPNAHKVKKLEVIDNTTSNFANDLSLKIRWTSNGMHLSFETLATILSCEYNKFKFVT